MCIEGFNLVYSKTQFCKNEFFCLEHSSFVIPKAIKTVFRYVVDLTTFYEKQVLLLKSMNGKVVK